MDPKVSIVMPVLNGKRYIGEAVASVVAQTYRNYELIVVDDGSTDSTCDEVERFLPKLDVKYVRHRECQGIPRSMNDGIRNSSGELIAFLDHDDTWEPNFLETQVTYLQQHPETGMVHCDFRTIDAQGKLLEASMAPNGIEPSGYVFPQLFMRNLICGDAVLIRRHCVERFGGFDERLRWGDYHLWLRIARHYNIDFVPQVLTSYRQHVNQSTQSEPAQEPVGIKTVQYIVEEYPEIVKELGGNTIRRRMASLYLDYAYAWLGRGAPKNCRAALGRAIRLWPLKWRCYLVYTLSLLQPTVIVSLKERWIRFRSSA